MLLSLATILLNVTASSGAACSETKTATDHHLASVCAPYLGGASAYSVTYHGSLTPKPASQQVMVHKADDTWFVRMAGFRWEPGSSKVVTKRNELEITDGEAKALIGKWTKASLERLSALPYYGSDDVICMDGASIELAMAEQNRKYRAAQHTCAGKTEITVIAADFRQLALKYDADFEGLLTGLK